jgi:LacI family transcriptional regulator
VPDLAGERSAAGEHSRAFLRKGPRPGPQSPGSTTSALAEPGWQRAPRTAGLASLVAHGSADPDRRATRAAQQRRLCLFACAGHSLLRRRGARVLRALCENVRGALNVVQPRVEILTAEKPQ